MSNPKDGGPAYPTKRYDPVKLVDGTYDTKEVTYPGMSLRDYFAGQALAGLVAEMKDDASVQLFAGDISIVAYKVAASMLLASGEEQ